MATILSVKRKIHKIHQGINRRFDVRISNNDKNIYRLKDLHKGERAFIIGSGHSLRVTDLDVLKSEITFACNKIYLAFEHTLWRPTYYSVSDKLVAENNKQIINTLCVNKIFVSSVYNYFSNSKDITWLMDLGQPNYHSSDKFKFSSDLLRGVYHGWTITYTMLQMAFYMGIKEVYLLGIDYYYDLPMSSKNDEKILVCEGEINHFHNNYRTRGEKWSFPELDKQYKAFSAADIFFKNSGRNIINTSEGTKLDLFPKYDLSSFIAKRECEL